jgi:arylsulfatase A-like enzyme
MVDDTHLVSSVDLLPTVCDYARVPVPPGVQGRSLRPLVRGDEVGGWRTCAYAENQVFNKMIRSRRYKYIVEYVPNGPGDLSIPSRLTHRIGKEQLYDMVADPGERKNTANDPAAARVLAEHRKLLEEQEARLERRPFAFAGTPGDGVASRIADDYKKRLGVLAGLEEVP